VGILRSMNRRGIGTETIGFYSVLRPSRWLPASRFSDDYNHRLGQSTGDETPKREALGNTGCEGTTIFLQTLQPSAEHRHVMRTLLIALAAISIAFAVLWWITLGAGPNAY
jgi:hypothetical protein